MADLAMALFISSLRARSCIAMIIDLIAFGARASVIRLTWWSISMRSRRLWVTRITGWPWLWRAMNRRWSSVRITSWVGWSIVDVLNR